MPESFPKPSANAAPREVSPEEKAVEVPISDNPEQPRPNRDFIIETREARKQEKISLAKEIIERNEVFQFPGISAETYANIKRDEEEFPGYTTPIDELLERFNREGAKVVLGKNPESGNVFIVPAQTGDITTDTLFPRQLKMNNVSDEQLRELIRLDGGR